jgi:polysaccharide biosynthesis transport protein
VTFTEYLTVLQRRWRVWAPILLMGIAVALAINAIVPVKYTAVSTSFVTVTESPNAGSGGVFQNSQFAVQRVKSYAPLSSSPEVLQPVIDQLDLNMTIRQLREMVEVTSPPDTVLLQVAVTDRNADRAARIADAISIQLAELIEALETPRERQVSLVKVSLTQPAEVPISPSSPGLILTLILGMVAGAALGLAAALVRHHMDRRIKSDDDIQTITGMSPAGSTLASRRAKQALLVALDYRSVGAERYRTIRTALKLAYIDKELHHFVVSSPTLGEGKTTVAANLAISWAHAGSSVCLVEADFRRPTVTKILGLNGGAGLSDVALGEVDLDDALIPWNDGMLTVLPAGSIPADPTALLSSSTLRELVNWLHSRFDMVIYDSPAINSMTDAIVLAGTMDGLVLVVRSGSTTRDSLAKCVDAVRKARLRLLGTVKAGVKVRGKAGQHYYASENNSHLEKLPSLLSKVSSGPERPRG